MQVTLPPPPVMPNGLTQDMAARTVPHVMAQAAAPVIQRAVAPSTRTEGGNKTRSNSDKAKGKNPTDDKTPGHTINIRV